MKLVLALLLLSTALDEDPAFQEGLRLYRDVEFEQALFRFQAAATEPGRPEGERVVLFQWLGMTYAALEREEASNRAFKDALRLDVEAQLPPDAAPKLRDRYEELRQEVRDENAADDPQEDPAPDDPPLDEPPPPGESPPEQPASFRPVLFASAGTAAAVAVLASAAGALVVVLATQTAAVAEDPDEFQDERIAALERANTQLGVSYGLFAAGGAMVALAGGLGAAAFVVE